MLWKRSPEYRTNAVSLWRRRTRRRAVCCWSRSPIRATASPATRFRDSFNPISRRAGAARVWGSPSSSASSWSMAATFAPKRIIRAAQNLPSSYYPQRMSESVLIVDDERGIRDTLRGVLEDEGFTTAAVATGEECLKALERRAYGCVLLDVWLPGIDGLETLKQMRASGVDAAVIIISGHGNIETAVRATKLGAFDFIEKPLSIEKTVLAVRNALRQQRLELINADMAAALAREYTMVGESVAMRALRKQISVVAPTDGRVLIYGESGTGKELVARAIHAESRRAAAPFVEVNSAAIPEELIESELFGHVKGAFTGATAAKKGKFELADGATIFLDEVGDMSPKVQAK